jgi:hypothetical protein
VTPVPRARAARTLALAGALAVSALALAACTSAPGPQAQVPTLPTSGSAGGSAAGTTTTSADPDAGRPRERLDMTAEESDALDQVYTQCLVTNGYDKSRNGKDQAALTKAEAACVSKDPLPPWELDASNPHAADFVHAVVLCLRAKGVRYVSEEPPDGGAYAFSFGGPGNDSSSITKGLEYTPDCEKQVAAQGIGS